MESYEVLKESIKDVGAKSIASDMSLSLSLIYKWCQPHYAGGADSPLDRMSSLLKLTGKKEPIHWLCEQAGGFFVENAGETSVNTDVDLLKGTQDILKEFTELLEAISRGSEDGKITKGESETIRKEWEDLKRVAECFVNACEKGVYDKE